MADGATRKFVSSLEWVAAVDDCEAGGGPAAAIGARGVVVANGSSEATLWICGGASPEGPTDACHVAPAVSLSADGDGSGVATWERIDLASECDGASARYDHGAGLIDYEDGSQERIFVCGGTGFSGVTDSAFLIDPATRAVSVASAEGDVPSARTSFGFCTMGARAFLFGGHGGGASDRPDAAVDDADLYVADVGDGRCVWSKAEVAAENGLAALPLPRMGCTLTAVPESGEIFLFGGMDSGTVYGDAWVYTLASQKWSLIHDAADGEAVVPAPRSGHGAARATVCVDGELIEGVAICGGFGGMANPVMYGDAWFWSPVSREWLQLAADASDSLGRRLDPTLVYVADAANAANGGTRRLLVFGGASEDAIHGSLIGLDLSSGC